jgi:signal transduction histidine kinase
MPPDIMLKIIIMLGLISIPIVLAAGAVCLYRGYKPARFYLMANILFLLGIVINLFADLSLIPMNFIAEHGMRIGSGVDVTLTSIALADRINILRGELELAEIKTKALNLQLDQYNKTLEQRVLERTTQLKESRDRLVQAEKMASLGELVSGVAHEINTPIGIGVTAASTLTKSTQSLETSLKNNTMTKTDFERYLDTARQSSELILKHLLRAGELVKSFKMVSADQTSSEKRQFLIGAYIEDVITSLRPEIKKTSLNIKINYVKDIEISSYPGAIAQIITNLLMNSIIHGYEKGSQGNIIIDISQTVDRVLIDFKDDGKGIEGDILPKIFNPFFTTRRGFGGTGLGLNIVFNLINQTLKGAITCQSELKAGTVFHISLPIEV